MSKEEAIQAMKEGKRLTHRLFAADEWMTMQEGMVILEDGVVCTPRYYWQWRTDPGWDDGYKLFD